MGNNDRRHFDQYPEQTRLKHDILRSYLKAYLQIIRRGSKNLVYIDGFAGKGCYTDEVTSVDGSPLIALRIIAEDDNLADRVSTIFIESDPLLFSELHKTVKDFYTTHPRIRKPFCKRGLFSESVDEILDQVPQLAPTFLFVDPCGVKGTSFRTIQRVMDNRKCETFMFFNYNGLNRVLGLDETSPTLIEMLGSQEHASKLVDSLRDIALPRKREEFVVDYYRHLLQNAMYVKYVIPFRIESCDTNRTSHYLIHATKHPIGFRIMKDVMWKRSRSELSPGSLAFEQSSHCDIAPMFDMAQPIKDRIVATLKSGRRRVSFFCEEQAALPDDFTSPAEYKLRLIELESDGTIEVLDNDCNVIITQSQRRTHNGRPTLGNGYYVRLKDIASGAG